MTQPTAVRSVKKAPVGNKRVLVFLGVGVALLLVTFVLPKVLFGSGGSGGGEELTAPPIAGGVAGPETTVAPTTPGVPTAPGVTTPPPETVEVFTNKNPFTPLVDENADGSSGATDVSSPATGTDGDPSTSTPPAATDGPRPVQKVSLIDISTDEDGTTWASIQVNDTLYQVTEGEDFAGSYRVVALSETEGCAQLLYGDDSFRVCEGEELLK